MPVLSIGEIKYMITLHKKNHTNFFLRNFGQGNFKGNFGKILDEIRIGLGPNFGPKSGPKNNNTGLLPCVHNISSSSSVRALCSRYIRCTRHFTHIIKKTEDWQFIIMTVLTLYYYIWTNEFNFYVGVLWYRGTYRFRLGSRSVDLISVWQISSNELFLRSFDNCNDLFGVEEIRCLIMNSFSVIRSLGWFSN